MQQKASDFYEKDLGFRYFPIKNRGNFWNTVMLAASKTVSLCSAFLPLMYLSTLKANVFTEKVL